MMKPSDSEMYVKHNFDVLISAVTYTSAAAVCGVSAAETVHTVYTATLVLVTGHGWVTLPLYTGCTLFALYTSTIPDQYNFTRLH